MKQKRIDEIREVIQDLRDAENSDEIAPRLYSRARNALLELLDEVKVPFPATYFDEPDEE